MDQRSTSTIEDLYFPYKEFVLALPGWYPTWKDPLPGDFNQRHIIAASLYMPQVVLYIGKDPSGTLSQVETRYQQLSTTAIEICVLYPQHTITSFDAVHSNLSFLKLLYQYAALIEARWGRPRLLHSYIVVRGGLAGWLLSGKWNLPFVLTENWTIYYPEDPGYLPQRNMLFKWVVRRVFNQVSLFLPVTENLYKRVHKLIRPVPFVTIPNVVDTKLFNSIAPQKSGGPFRFVHVSTMIYQKNPEGLLRGFKAFTERYANTLLLMVGPYDKEVEDYCRSLGLPADKVVFTGAVPYTTVANLLHTAEALVLFSRYENLPCVILEALCCGMPVISTLVGGIDEVIDASNGILLPNEDEAALVQALCNMYACYDSFNRKKIAESAFATFSYTAVGKKINDAYTRVITS